MNLRVGGGHITLTAIVVYIHAYWSNGFTIRLKRILNTKKSKDTNSSAPNVGSQEKENWTSVETSFSSPIDIIIS